MRKQIDVQYLNFETFFTIFYAKNLFFKFSHWKLNKKN